MSAREVVLANLRDGLPRSCTSMAAEAELSRNAIQQAISRLWRAGMQFTREGEFYLRVDARYCSACGRRLTARNRSAFCYAHSRRGLPS